MIIKSKQNFMEHIEPKNLDKSAFRPDSEKMPSPLKNESLVESGVLARTKFVLERAKIISSLETDQEIKPKERQELIGMLENRAWYKILRLKPGDKIAYFMAPAGDFSIKNLNDHLFGPQMTDQIINKRNQLLQESLVRKGLASLLNQDFRSAIYHLADKDIVLTQINEVCEEVNRNLSAFLANKNSGLIRQRRDELVKDASLDGPILIKKIGLLDEFENKVKKFGFKLTYGISQVKDSPKNPLLQPILAVAEASQTAQLSRHGQLDKFGLQHNEDIVAAEIDRINRLRQEIAEKYATFTDVNGQEYAVFSQTEGRLVFNRDLMRAIRKEQLVPSPDHYPAFRKLQEYVRRSNLIDIVKPFTAAELSGLKKIQSRQSLEQFMEEIGNLSQALAAGSLSEQDRKRIAEILNSDARDLACDSAEKFHQETMKIEDCVYITIDALDVGVELLLEYEKLLQEFEMGKKSLEQISLIAGDEMTDNLRDKFRQKALDVCHKYFREQKIADAQVFSLVGGDELVLAFKNQPNLDQLMIKLQKETKGRLVKTVVAQADRHDNQGLSEQERLVQHLAAIKRSELGTELAKEIEMKKREITLRLGQDLAKRGESKSQIKLEIENLFSQLELDNFYVKEKADGNFVIVTSAGQEFSPKELKFRIEQLLAG